MKSGITIILFVQLILSGCGDRNKNQDELTRPTYVNITHANYQNELIKFKSRFTITEDDLDNIDLWSERKTQRYVDSLSKEVFKPKDIFEIIFHTSRSLTDSLKVVWIKSNFAHNYQDTILYHDVFTWRDGNKLIRINKKDLKGQLKFTYRNKIIAEIDLPREYNVLAIRCRRYPIIDLNFLFSPPAITD